jgi:hypothetical protein
MPMPENPFMPPVSLRQLLANLEQWPSPDPWPFVPSGTQRVTMDTQFSLLTFDRCEEFDDEEYEAFERWAASQGFESFLNDDQLIDVRDSLGYEIEALEESKDLEIAQRHYDAILIRAINHYSEMDAFVSLKDWTGAGGRVMKGILADYES